MRKYLVLLLVAGLAMAHSTADMSPYISGTPANPGEADFNILDSFNIEDFSYGQYNVGLGFDGTYFWISEGYMQGGGDANYIYIVDAEDYTLVTDVEQNNSSGWGLRDWCYDGEYMFASMSNDVDYYDPATYEKAGSYTCGAVSPNRAQAWDGTYFYTGSFSETIYQVEWDGVSGSTATYTEFSTAVGNGGTYGAAYDEWDDCLWVSTASDDGMLYQIAMDGSLIDSYNIGPEIPMAGGCTPAPYDGNDQLWVLAQDSPDMVYCLEIHEEALSPATWGEIKSLF
jgi:hypothetical protein